MKMWVFIVRRLFLLIPVVVGVMTITFALISALPVQTQLVSAFGAAPAHAPWLYQPTIPQGQGGCPSSSPKPCTNNFYYTALAKLGLNKPIYVQWAIYIYHSFTFQWGYVDNHSYAASQDTALVGQPVTTVLAWYFPYTLELATLSLFLILIISIPLGNLAAVNRNRPIDQAARILSFSGFAMPTFLLASLVLMGAVIAFGASTHYFSATPWCPSGMITFAEFYKSWPPSNCFGLPGNAYPSYIHLGGVYTTPTGFPTVDALIAGQYWIATDTVLRMILPALVIAFGSIAFLLRFVRNSMLEVMNLDYVRTARSEGIPANIITKRHAGRNSLNVTVTVLGLTFAFFLGGFPIIEYVYGLNGVGLMLALSVQPAYDFSLIFGSTLLFTYLIVFANLIVDVLYAVLDPRVRLG